jgi:hypothetical protein
MCAACVLAADLLNTLPSSAPSSPSSSARSSPELLLEFVDDEGELTEEALQGEFTSTPNQVECLTVYSKLNSVLCLAAEDFLKSPCGTPAPAAFDALGQTG